MSTPRAPKADAVTSAGAIWLPLTITGGYRATSGTRPTFPTPQQAEAYDAGFRSWWWGQSCPSDAASADGWHTAELRFEKSRDDALFATRNPERNE